jgi:hypothetical protein
MKKKRLLFCVAAFYGLIVLLNYNACGQTQISSKPSLTPNQVTGQHWRPRIETEFTNSYESFSKQTLIEMPVSRTELTFEKKLRSGQLWISAEAVTSLDNRKPWEGYLNIGFGIKKQIGKLGLSGSAKFLASQEKQFGVMDVEINRSFNLAEEVSIEPFSKFSYVIPLETGRTNINQGAVWQNGARFSGSVGSTELEVTGQLIADSGAIYAGRRLTGNCEAVWLFSLGRVKLGPKLGLSHYFAGFSSPLSHKKNQLNFGILFRVG